jgi:hypothetical protein
VRGGKEERATWWQGEDRDLGVPVPLLLREQMRKDPGRLVRSGEGWS